MHGITVISNSLFSSEKKKKKKNLENYLTPSLQILYRNHRNLSSRSCWTRSHFGPSNLDSFQSQLIDFPIQWSHIFCLIFQQPHQRWSWKRNTIIIGCPAFPGTISLAQGLELDEARTQSRLVTRTLWIRRNQQWWSNQTTS